MKKNELATKSPQERITMSSPVLLQYFQSIDFALNGVSDTSNHYNDILIYEPGSDGPTIRICRSKHTMLNKNTTIQDEIEVIGQEFRMNFSAERDESGKYISNMTLGDENEEYLKSINTKFKELLSVDGSVILIDRSKTFVSQKGIWLEGKIGYEDRIRF